MKVMPISNAEIERCFHSYNYIKNSLRTKLENEKASNLLFIYKLKIALEVFEKQYLDKSIIKWVDDNPTLRFI